MSCQFCSEPLTEILNLGDQPICNAFLNSTSEFENEKKYPLRLCYCRNCGLTQLSEVLPREILFPKESFNYLSSSSKGVVDYYEWLANRIKKRANPSSIVEIAGNDGTFLKHFNGINRLNIEPAKEPASISEKNGIVTVQEYFEDFYSKLGFRPDVICAFDVMAHCSKLHDFLVGIKQIMDESTVLVLQVQDLEKMMKHNAYDTIYHEHLRFFDYSSLTRILGQYGIRIFEFEATDFYGGSLIAYCRLGEQRRMQPWGQESFLNRFAERTFRLGKALIDACDGIDYVGIGAPMKSSTLLNWLKLSPRYLTETNPLKIGTFSPGRHIPVVEDSRLFEDKPDYALLLSWNLRDSIISKLKSKGYSGKFIIPIPSVEIKE